MVIALNGLGWQTAIQQQQRTSNEQALNTFLPVQQVAATSNTSAQQNSQSSTSGQNAQDWQNEAFAKMMVMLQNPDAAASEESGSATQQFREFMAKSPEEMIKEKILQEIGLTEDEYNALPPEQKASIDEQVAQRLQEDVHMKTQAKLQQAQADSAENSLTASVTQDESSEQVLT